jgi:hypothetical protein
MNDKYIGKGELSGCGVYAGRSFKEGEVVCRYHLMYLSDEEYALLPESEKMFTHRLDGKIVLYGIPARYVNHSSDPNTVQDVKQKCDVACRDIERDEMITTDASKEFPV